MDCGVQFNLQVLIECGGQESEFTHRINPVLFIVDFDDGLINHDQCCLGDRYGSLLVSRFFTTDLTREHVRTLKKSSRPRHSDCQI